MIKAIETKKDPENIYTPNIVEYQWGSNVISQSNAAKLIVKANTRVPIPESFLKVIKEFFNIHIFIKVK